MNYIYQGLLEKDANPFYAYIFVSLDCYFLVSPHPSQQWLRKAVEKRLREELAQLQVEVNEDKSRKVDLQQGESFGFLGFEFHRVRSRRGRWMPLLLPKGKKRPCWASSKRSSQAVAPSR
jgi:hypothetical protein